MNRFMYIHLVAAWSVVLYGSRTSAVPIEPLKQLREGIQQHVLDSGDAHAPIDDGALAAAWATASAPWPEVEVPPSVFGYHLARCLAQTEGAGLGRLQLPDLYLACGLSLGIETAALILRERILSKVPMWTRRVGLAADAQADVVQDVARELLVALKAYSAKGPLEAFIRVIAVRCAQRRGKATREASSPAAVDSARAAEPDPEIAVLRERFRHEFEEAFRETLLELDGEQRTILRLHYLDGLTLEQIAATYRVSRATAARTLARARDRIVSATQEKLSLRLGTGSVHNVESVFALVRSQLDLSIGGLMKRPS
jgi:RNA polymerase sigma-70 factor, ECF subfamily